MAAVVVVMVSLLFPGVITNDVTGCSWVFILVIALFEFVKNNKSTTRVLPPPRI